MEEIIKELTKLNKIIADTNSTLGALVEDMKRLGFPDLVGMKKQYDDLEKEHREEVAQEVMDEIQENSDSMEEKLEALADCPECGREAGKSHSNSCVAVE